MSTPAFNFDPKERFLEDFLTPVYFENEVLVKYLYSQTIAVEFASETYGTIYWPEHYMPFGINGGGAVLAWLGDLKELPPAEQYHWHGLNIASQHDMKSEFYDAQIKAEFTDPPIGIQTINALEQWNAAFARKYGIKIYKPKSYANRIESVRRYRRILIQSEDDFVRFISELNEIINESVDTDQIRNFLATKGVTHDKEMRGNKLLELVYNKVLGDTTNIIQPFFMLYDLRLWADHDMGDSKLRDVATKLSIANLKDFDQILTSLMAHLRVALNKLTATYG